MPPKSFKTIISLASTTLPRTYKDIREVLLKADGEGRTPLSMVVDNAVRYFGAKDITFLFDQESSREGRQRISTEVEVLLAKYRNPEGGSPIEIVAEYGLERQTTPDKRAIKRARLESLEELNPGFPHDEMVLILEAGAPFIPNPEFECPELVAQRCLMAYKPALDTSGAGYKDIEVGNLTSISIMWQNHSAQALKVSEIPALTNFRYDPSINADSASIPPLPIA